MLVSSNRLLSFSTSSPSSNSMKLAARSSFVCNRRASRPRCVSAHARLFKIRSLHSDQGSVILADAEQEAATPPAAQEAASATPQPVPEDGTTAAAPPAAPSTQTEAKPKTRPQLAVDSRSSLMASAGRKLIYATPQSIKYLDGSLPGDYGFDPLGLADPSRVGQPGEDQVMNLRWLSYAELIHGRWAMLAAAGALATEVLGHAGIIPQQTALPWFEAGGVLSATTGGVQGIPFVADIPIRYWADQGTLLWTMLVAMGFAELRRLQDYRYPGSMGEQYFLGMESVLGGSGDARYPGGQLFNLFNLGGGDNNSRSMFEMKVKEVKNGRLAMVAWLGFMVQACTTHKGPVQNLLDHMSAPATNNILPALGSAIQHTPPGTQAAAAIWLAAGFAAGALYKRAQDSELAPLQAQGAGTATGSSMSQPEPSAPDNTAGGLN